MATLPEVRKALADTLTAGTKKIAHAYAPAIVTPPCIIPVGVDVSPETQDGGRQISVSLWCCVPATHDQFQEKLDEFVVGAQSVTAVLERTPGLGLSAVSAVWTSAGNYSLSEWGGVPMWVAVVDVEIAF